MFSLAMVANISSLPEELLLHIFEYLKLEDLEKIERSICYKSSHGRSRRFLNAVKSVKFSHIVITNYSRKQVLDKKDVDAGENISKFRLDRCFYVGVDDYSRLSGVLAEAQLYDGPKKIYYIFGKNETGDSLHRVIRQFSKYLSMPPQKCQKVASELHLSLNHPHYIREVYEFRKDLEELIIIFLNFVINKLSLFEAVEGIYITNDLPSEIMPYESPFKRLFKIHSLQTLKIKNQFLNSVESVHIPRSLKNYDLSFNKITNIHTPVRAANLQKLNLSHNSITALPSDVLPQGLVELDLSYNNLKILNGKIFPSGLRKLNLSFNHIEKIQFIIPPGLEILDLTGCEIKGIEHSARERIQLQNIKVLL